MFVLLLGILMHGLAPFQMRRVHKAGMELAKTCRLIRNILAICPARVGLWMFWIGRSRAQSFSLALVPGRKHESGCASSKSNLCLGA